jgi:hypothetical protein
MRQVILTIIATLLATSSFSQTTLTNSSNQTRVQKPIEQENFSISTKDTLKYQFQNISNNKALYKNFKVDIGSINYGQPLIHYDFYLTNNSDTPLVIQHAYWAEPSFSPNYSINPIAKGETGLLTYSLKDTKKQGVFSKTGTVITNLGNFNINFKGVNLPPDIFINHPIKIDTIKLGEKITSEFKIHNKSETQALIIEDLQINLKTLINYDNDEVNKYQNTIPPNSYRTFKASFFPDTVGDSSSKINIKINGITVEHLIFATVQQLKNKNKPKSFRKRSLSK